MKIYTGPTGNIILGGGGLAVTPPEINFTRKADPAYPIALNYGRYAIRGSKLVTIIQARNAAPADYHKRFIIYDMVANTWLAPSAINSSLTTSTTSYNLLVCEHPTDVNKVLALATTKAMYAYDIVSDTWSLFSAAGNYPANISASPTSGTLRAFVIGGVLYILSRDTTTGYPRIMRLNVDGTYTQLAANTSPLGRARVAVAHGTKIYCFYGVNNMLSGWDVYDTVADSWSTHGSTVPVNISVSTSFTGERFVVSGRNLIALIRQTATAMTSEFFDIDANKFIASHGIFGIPSAGNLNALLIGSYPNVYMSGADTARLNFYKVEVA